MSANAEPLAQIAESPQEELKAKTESLKLGSNSGDPLPKLFQDLVTWIGYGQAARSENRLRTIFADFISVSSPVAGTLQAKMHNAVDKANLSSDPYAELMKLAIQVVLEDPSLAIESSPKAKFFDLAMRISTVSAVPRSLGHAFNLLRRFQFDFRKRTTQGVYTNIYERNSKLHFTNDRRQRAPDNFIWMPPSPNTFGNSQDPEDKHAIIDTAACSNDLANLAPVIKAVLKGKFRPFLAYDIYSHH